MRAAVGKHTNAASAQMVTGARKGRRAKKWTRHEAVKHQEKLRQPDPHLASTVGG